METLPINYPESDWEQIALDNFGLVKFTVGKYYINSLPGITARTGMTYDDLIQVGWIGLTKAVMNFDTSHGAKFSTYAVSRILGDIQTAIRDSSGLVRAPRTVKALKHKIFRDGNEDLSPKEVAEFYNVPEELAIQTINYRFSPMFLEKVLENTEENVVYLQDIIEDDTPSVEYQTEISMLLEKLYSFLTEEEKIVCNMYYLEDKTQAEIAHHLDRSQMQVSRILRRVKARLEPMKGEFGYGN